MAAIVVISESCGNHISNTCTDAIKIDSVISDGICNLTFHNTGQGTMNFQTERYWRKEIIEIECISE